jgi:hypothetical protein
MITDVQQLAVRMNLFTRNPQWLQPVLGLKDDEVPRGLFLPGVIATVDILSVADAAVSGEATTTLGERLPSMACTSILIQSDPANGDDVQIGIGAFIPGTLPFHTLTAGQFFSMDASNLQLIQFQSAGAGAVRITWTILRPNPTAPAV